MNRKIFALAFSLCMVTMQTYAANWVLVSTNNLGHVFFVDKSSLQRDGASVTFWTKGNYAERAMDGALSGKGQFTINCQRRERILRYIMTYDDKDHRGRLLVSGDPKDKWIPIAPETVDWEMMLFVCRK